MLLQVGHAEDGRKADPPRLALVPQPLDGVLLGPLLDEEAQHVGVLVAGLRRGEDLLRGPLGGAHQLDEALPLVLLDGDQEDEAVAAAEDLPGVERAHAEAVGVPPGIGPGDERRLQHGGDVRLAGQVDAFALPGGAGPVVGGERRRRAGDAGLQLGLVAERPQRRQLGPRRGARAEPPPATAVDDGQLGGPVAGLRVGAGEPEGRDGAHHEVVPTAVERTGGVRADHHVGVAEQRRPGGGRVEA